MAMGHEVLEEEDGDKHQKGPPQQQQQQPIKPNFGLSGALATDMETGNLYKGVVLKFKEPPEARTPNTQWRFYVFKKKTTTKTGNNNNSSSSNDNDGGAEHDVLETLHVSKQSAYLFGRNTTIADIPILHPSLSGQHAVLQYRAVPVGIASAGGGSGIGGGRQQQQHRLSCQPYIMDLESTNGTFLNGVRIDPARYYQLRKGDVLTFGASTREYVLLTENTTSTTTNTNTKNTTAARPRA
jgi:smad nuclear-interacting protein 1